MTTQRLMDSQCEWPTEKQAVKVKANFPFTDEAEVYEFDPVPMRWAVAQMHSVNGVLVRDLVVTREGRIVLQQTLDEYGFGSLTHVDVLEACHMALLKHRKWNNKHHKDIEREAKSEERKDKKEAKEHARLVKACERQALKQQKAVERAERKRVKDLDKDRARQERIAQKQVRVVEQRLAMQAKRRRAEKSSEEDDDSESSNSSVVSDEASSEDSDTHISLLQPAPLKRTKRVRTRK